MADRSVVVRLSMETSEYLRNARQAAQATKEIERSAVRTDQAIDHLGNTAGTIGLVAGAAFAGVVSAAANFDEAMSHVAATGEDARASIKALREEALEAGARTKFSATEAAQGIQALEKAGVEARDILAGGLDGALDLAASGQLAVADAAEITATALTQFQLEGSEAVHVADLLAAGAGKAQGEVADMALALKYAGVPAANLGVSIEETAGTIALFAKNGIIGEQAGTSLRGMLASITSPSKVAAETMADLGISVFDARGRFVGLEGVAGQLQTRMQGLTQEERANALGRIFGNEQLQAANVLYREGAEGVREWTGNVNDSGYAAESAALMMDNLKGDVEKLGGALQTAFIGAGDGAQGPLRSLVQRATEAVDVFNALPGPVQSSASALLGVTALVGGAGFVAAKTINGVNEMRDSLHALGIGAGEADRNLGQLARRAAGMAGLAAAVVGVHTAIDALNGGIDTSTLDRDIEALADGRLTKNAKDLVGQMNAVGHSVSAVVNGGWMEKLGDAANEVATGFGALGDTPIDQVRKDIDAFDKTLAATVEAGHAEKAKEALAGVIKAIEESSGPRTAAKYRQAFDEYDTALDNMGSSADEAAEETINLGDASQVAAAEVSDLAAALEHANGVLSGRSDMRAYAASVDDATAALRRNGRTLDINTEEGRDNQAALDAIARAGFGVAASMEGLDRARALRRARRDFINTAVDMGMTRESALNLWRELMRIDRTKATADVRADTGQAMSQLSAFDAFYREVTRPRTTVITTQYSTGKGALPDLLVGPMRNPADGGTIPFGGGSPRRADMGATVPDDGLGYYDRYPYLLAPREEVVSNRIGQADEFRPELKAINAGASRREVFEMLAGRLADGGTVGLAGGGTTGRNDSQDGIRELGNAARETAKQMREAARAERERIRDLKRSLVDTVSDKFRSNIFQNDNPWSAGGDWRSQLRTETAQARQFTRDTRTLKNKGVKGGALDYLLTNADPSMVRGFAGMSKEELAEYSRLYTARERAAGAAGRAAGNAAYGAQLKAIERQLDRLNQRIGKSAEETGRAVGREINGAARNGSRRGNR